MRNSLTIMHTVMHTDRAPFVQACADDLVVQACADDLVVQACADDLADLTPDLLKCETGTVRHGVNRVRVFGEPETNAAPPPDPGAA